MADLTISTVNWNTRDILRDCLKSIFDTVHNLNFEIFIVDNASSDGSPEMVEKEFPRVKLIRNDANCGDSVGNNQVISGSEGEFILLLNSDTVVLPGTIEEMFWCMKENPSIAALACQSLYLDRKTVQHDCRRFPTLMTAFFDDTFLGRWFSKNNVIKRYHMRDWAHDDFREVEQPPITCFMVRRQVVNAVGSLDEKLFLYYTDVDLCLRIKKAGFKIFYTPHAQVVHYASASIKKSPNVYRDWHKDKFYYYRKHHGVHSVIAMKFILILDFFERLTKLLIKRALGRIETKEILSQMQKLREIIIY